MFVLSEFLIIPNIIRILLCWLRRSLTDEQQCLDKDLKLKKMCQQNFIHLSASLLNYWMRSMLYRWTQAVCKILIKQVVIA
jgi:hypothetical protein